MQSFKPSRMIEIDLDLLDKEEHSNELELRDSASSRKRPIRKLASPFSDRRNTKLSVAILKLTGPENSLNISQAVYSDALSDQCLGVSTNPTSRAASSCGSPRSIST